ncbi:MAG: hypothetical protein AB1445_01355 [Bacillota bacterium]
MPDRFVRGFLAGTISGIIGALVALVLIPLDLTPQIDFYDFAGILAVGRIPQTLGERAMGVFVDLVVSGVLGVIFAFLLLGIGTKYLLLKGWFYATAIWYAYYPLLLMIMAEEVKVMDVRTSLINAILAGFFGLVMAAAYFWLTPQSERVAHRPTP